MFTILVFAKGNKYEISWSPPIPIFDGYQHLGPSGPPGAPRPRGPKSENQFLNTHEMGLCSKFQLPSPKTLAGAFESHFCHKYIKNAQKSSFLIFFFLKIFFFQNQKNASSQSRGRSNSKVWSRYSENCGV